MSKLPDGPQIAPLLQLINWIANPFGFLDSCAKRYGDTFTIRLMGFRPFVFLSHPQAIQEVFTIDAKQFDAGVANSILLPLVGENSLLLLDTERHQQQRKLLMPPFHGERMRGYSKLIGQITESVTSNWSIGKPIATRAVMQEITIRVILHAVFGLSEGTRYQQLKPLLRSMLDLTGSPLSSSMIFFSFLQQDWGAWSPWGRVRQKQRQIDELLYAEIAERRQQTNSKDINILSVLMSAHDEQGELMTDVELRDELMTLLIAGHETTATAIAWAFYWIHRLPSVREKLLQELDSLGDNPEPMEIGRLPYLSAVCQETLRIYPVVPITTPRVTKYPVAIKGQQFDAGTTLAPCIYLTHHREELYPEPKQFKPERFIEHQFSPYEYFPFGGGNRRCIGYALAMLEMKLVLATVLTRYQLALVNEKEVKPARRGVTLAPANGVPLVMTGQRQQQPRQSFASSV